jgi:hypothetical protein
MESFEYLLELSMALTDGQADPDALREAYEALVAMDAERGRCTAVWDELSERDLATR